jgi:hypothetical protein
VGRGLEPETGKQATGHNTAGEAGQGLERAGQAPEHHQVHGDADTEDKGDPYRKAQASDPQTENNRVDHQVVEFRMHGIG